MLTRFGILRFVFKQVLASFPCKEYFTSGIVAVGDGSDLLIFSALLTVTDRLHIGVEGWLDIDVVSN